MTRGEGLSIATQLIKQLIKIAPEESDKGLTKKQLEEIVEHLKFVNQFYL